MHGLERHIGHFLCTLFIAVLTLGVLRQDSSTAIRHVHVRVLPPDLAHLSHDCVHLEGELSALPLVDDARQNRHAIAVHKAEQVLEGALHQIVLRFRLARPEFPILVERLQAYDNRLSGALALLTCINSEKRKELNETAATVRPAAVFVKNAQKFSISFPT